MFDLILSFWEIFSLIVDHHKWDSITKKMINYMSLHTIMWFWFNCAADFLKQWHFYLSWYRENRPTCHSYFYLFFNQKAYARFSWLRIELPCHCCIPTWLSIWIINFTCLFILYLSFGRALASTSKWKFWYVCFTYQVFDKSLKR